MVNSDRVLPWLGATIVVQPASVGSQTSQPHIEDGSVYRIRWWTLLDSLEPPDEEEVSTKRVVTKVGRGAVKPVRHSLHRTPTLTQQARWEAVQQAKRQGLSLRAIARKLGMSRVAASKYALAESPPTKLLSAKERARAEAMAASLIAAV